MESVYGWRKLPSGGTVMAQRPSPSGPIVDTRYRSMNWCKPRRPGRELVGVGRVLEWLALAVNPVPKRTRVTNLLVLSGSRSNCSVLSALTMTAEPAVTKLIIVLRVGVDSHRVISPSARETRSRPNGAKLASHGGKLLTLLLLQLSRSPERFLVPCIRRV